MAEIFSITYRPRDAEAHPADHYTRVPMQSAHLVVNHGIEGDVKGGNPNRQLNLMSYETLQALRAEGFSVEPGQMGEQLIVRGLDVNTLGEGTRLQLGESAVIELLKPRTGCDRFEAIQGHSPKLAAGRLGVLARVINGGSIRVGDSVTLLEPVQEA